MNKALLSILALGAIAAGCFFLVDSLFVEIGAAIVLTLLALLIPIKLLFRERRRER